MEKDNSNPTLINPGDLPTRRGRNIQKTTQDTDSIYELWDSMRLNDQIQVNDIEISGSISATDAEGDDEADPIDEQEIYGMLCLFLPTRVIVVVRHFLDQFKYIEVPGVTICGCVLRLC
jgi:hypothetical protein